MPRPLKPKIMATIKINEKLQDRRVSHNNVCAKPVGEHSEYELLQLGIAARSSNNKVLLQCFTELPTLNELTASKVAIDTKALKDNTLTKEPVSESAKNEVKNSK